MGSVGMRGAGAALADVAEAERELRQRRFRRAALEQQPDAGGEAGPVGAGLAVDQDGARQGAVQADQALQAVLVGGAAALQRLVGMRQTQPRRRRPTQRVRAAIRPVAAQVDDGAQPVPARRLS